MKLAQFIDTHMDQILAEWESFARTLHPVADTMSHLALQDHAKQILLAIAKDMRSEQTDKEQADKSKGLAGDSTTSQTAATIHGALRHVVGFDVIQVGAEFRALRASVLKLWRTTLSAANEGTLDEMTRFNESIDQALAESIARHSEEVSHSRDMFLAILGHDLRSPLSAVTMSAAVLAESRRLDDDDRGFVKRIRNSARTMDAMIRDLLDYTKTRLGRGLPVTAEPADLGSICEAALDEARAAHPQNAFHFESSGGLNGSFDSARLQQVLSNLLNNAVQHGSKDRAIVLSANGQGDTVKVQVKNYGTSIPPDALQVIFDPLVQLPSDGSAGDSRLSTSLGLGLHIAREIVVAHGGTIRAESSDKDGTVFTAELPRRRK
jgi:signal transduction histidine kinase